MFYIVAACVVCFTRGVTGKRCTEVKISKVEKRLGSNLTSDDSKMMMTVF